MAAKYQSDWQEPLGIHFRKGVGLVGQCIEANRPQYAHYIDFETAAYQSALASQDDWDNAPNSITRALEYSEAQALAERYGQALALVVRDGNEAIGCITLEVPPGVRGRLDASQAILDELSSAAQTLGAVLNARSRNDILN